ncbi:multicopper oxidase domain-containing protein [Bacillus sp. SCS-153A]|uniref:multicopper oxidase domain-containing protein n=1 Tax=Rossellomorea sedimentorum TaxID=3115294 RepID=UPI003906D161
MKKRISISTLLISFVSLVALIIAAVVLVVQLPSQKATDSEGPAKEMEVEADTEKLSQVDAVLPTQVKATVSKPVKANIQKGESVCNEGTPTRHFNIAAFEVDIVYNNFGDHDPNGKLYALKEDVESIKQAVERSPGKPVKEIQPLTIRANKGDCISVTFTNELRENASIQIQGVDYNVKNSDGTAVGYNPDSTAEPGNEVEYIWNASEEGTFYFSNGGDYTYFTDPSGGKGTLGNGLFGALIVEPEGAIWTDPETGEELKSGLYAVIEHPSEPDYREFALFFHDGISVVPGKPQKQEDSLPGEGEIEQDQEDEKGVKELYGVNLRAEPLDERVKNALTEDGEDTTMFYSSWIFGDPATPITPAYVGDPVQFKIIGSGGEENHVFHLHGHRWKSDTRKTETVDSETVNIGDAQTVKIKFGAGYVLDGKGAAGDYLWHCHLFPHYIEGMWGIMRVFDTLQPELLPLKDKESPPLANEENPGFPAYIPGEVGQRPPTSPDPELRPPTDEEKAVFKSLKPGAPNVDRCPRDAPLRTYEVSGIETKIVYNNAGDYDAEGRMFVLKENEERILSGEMRPRPLVIRANLGDCVEVTLDNHLYEAEEPNSLSMHIHFAAFDPLGSDGTTVGWNYNQGVRPGEKIRYRWYANEEGNILFHDHMSAGEKGFHGTFGALIVEPPGSKWLDPNTGKEVNSGTEAIIVTPDQPDFREQVLIYHDFVRLWDINGSMLPLEADPSNPIHAHGYSAVNYSNAPFFRRSSHDPAYVFSSWVHGDPQTPIIDTYPGDPVKIRLIQGAHETQHNFNLHGLNWKREPDNSNTELTSTQTIGTSEQYTMDIQPNPVGVKQRDYLWSSQPIEDLWSGLWGFVRVWGEEKENLIKLPDRENLKEKVDKVKMNKMKKEGKRPKKADNPGSLCPKEAPVKKFDVTAFLKEIEYNEWGDHDPFGMMFALTEDVEAIKHDTKPTEPLVIRANSGDCIQVTLRNGLPLDPPENKNDPDLLMAKQVTWNFSNRVSLHPQMLQYDVQGSDGATVGYNHDQTIGPGETIQYTWYADKEYGGTILYDYGDIRSHRLHGGYGALIIEPKGAQYRDPATGESLRSGARADIIVPKQPDFREQVLMFSDGLYTIGKDGTPPTPGEADPNTGESGDLEDRGEKGINYRSEPFRHRLAQNKDKSLVFSSVIHGDPSTPIPEAYIGDPIRFRVMQTADRSRGSVFTLHSHRWHYQWTDPTSKLVSSQGSLTPGETLDIMPVQNDNLMNFAGDYLYREMKLRRYLEGGLWGIFRIHGQPETKLRPLPDRLPSKPKHVKFSPDRKTITWELPESNNIAGFNIYQKRDLEQRFLKINKELIKDAFFIVPTFPDSNSVEFSVTAIDRYGNESQFSNSIKVKKEKDKKKKTKNKD